jgi:long-chain acyl-CoA synthetase
MPLAGQARMLGTSRMRPGRGSREAREMNIASLLDRRAAETPVKTALRTAGTELSYADLNLWSSAVATQLTALGLVRSDRVGVLAGSNADFVATVYGIWKLGAIAVLLNPQLSPADLGRQVRTAGVGVIVVDGEPARRALAGEAGDQAGGVRVVRADRRPAAAVPAAGLDSGAIAMIAFTSGTTGTAKGAAHTHGALLTQVEMVAAHYCATPDDEIMALLPLFLLSIFVVGPLLALALGASCRVVGRYDALDIAALMERDRTTIAAAVPLFFYDLRELASEPGRGFDLSAVRVITSGGAALPEGTRDDLEHRFGFRLLQLYGMTEAPAIVTSDPVDGGRKEGSVGRALPHIRVTIEDDVGRELPPGAIGEVCISAVGQGPLAGRYTAMACYWGMPEQTARALQGGKLHTGDVGYLDEEEFLYLVDRKKDIIIRGGMNIYPRELEVTLAADGRVAECVVVGEAHPRYGEVPVAYVRLRPGAQAAAGELLDMANRQLASSQRLQAVHVVADFPRNSLGKVVRRELAHACSAEGTADE